MRDWELEAKLAEREVEEWYAAYKAAVKQAERETEKLMEALERTEDELKKTEKALNVAIKLLVRNKFCPQHIECVRNCYECLKEFIFKKSQKI